MIKKKEHILSKHMGSEQSTPAPPTSQNAAPMVANSGIQGMTSMEPLHQSVMTLAQQTLGGLFQPSTDFLYIQTICAPVSDRDELSAKDRQERYRRYVNFFHGAQVVHSKFQMTPTEAQQSFHSLQVPSVPTFLVHKNDHFRVVMVQKPNMDAAGIRNLCAIYHDSDIYADEKARFETLPKRTFNKMPMEQQNQAQMQDVKARLYTLRSHVRQL